MKKLFSLSLAVLLAAFTGKAQFNTAGIASFSGGIIDLVPVSVAPCQDNVAGAAWSQSTVNFNTSFSLTFEAAFVHHGLSWIPGADGLVVAFGENINNAPGGSVNDIGGAMGYYHPIGGNNPDFQNSIGIEFDIYENNPDYNDPGTGVHHIMIARDGNPNSVIHGNVPIRPGNASVQDNAYHQYRIDWDCVRQELKIWFEPSLNPHPRVVSGFSPAAVFANPASVFWGFTAARAYGCSDHLVRNVVMTPYPCSDCADVRFRHFTDSKCVTHFGATVTPALNVYVAAYEWNFGDGSPTVTTGSPNISYTYTAPGIYQVTLRVIAYNATTGQCCSQTVTRVINVVCDEGGGEDEVPMRKAQTGRTGKNQLTLAPNPSKGSFNIELAGSGFKEIKVYDATGKLVHSEAFGNTNSKTVQMEQFASGIYVVEVLDGEGNTFRNKIVLQR